MRTTFDIGVALVLLGSLVGCALFGPEIEAGSRVHYAGGAVEGLVQATPRRLQLAVAITLDDMGMTFASARQDAEHGRVVARGRDGERVVVTIRRQAGGLTELSVKVGLLGDRARSEQIFEQVVANA